MRLTFVRSLAMLPHGIEDDVMLSQTVAIETVQKLHDFTLSQAVGSLAVKASDSRPKDMGSMPNATKYPPSSQGVRKLVAPKVLWAVAAETTGARGMENIFLPSSSMPELWRWR
ncbi:hypothetical protein TNCV_3568371 [Trichonephila clavipes]|nr:hypothetical protein TNCV_3568371 [Trichonephila clavipes]